MPINECEQGPRHRLNVAVIGTGVAGLSAAWLISKRHMVTVYEKDKHIGGHSNTVDAPVGKAPVPVDTGFIVYNERNYPNLTALFEHLGVPTVDSDMSFAASLQGGRFEYSGTGLNGLFGQRRNVLKPRFWRLILDILRFYREAPAQLDALSRDGLSLGDFVERQNYSGTFIEDHVLPMGAAIWSTTVDEMRAYPAAAFVRFFESHGLLTMKDRPQWRTVAGGSREYVRRLSEPFRTRVRHDAAVAIVRTPGGVSVRDGAGKVVDYDHVVIATHADEALRLLADPDERESRLLGAWRYTANRAVLHGDSALMPRRRRVWSSWNFIGGEPGRGGDPATESLCVTYWMNRLQNLDPANPLFVTLNPIAEPEADKVHGSFAYTHPLFDQAALDSHCDLWSLQGRRRTWFCGSYFGYGFHEDALQSGLAVAEQLGEVRRPWTVPDESGRITLGPSLSTMAGTQAA